ncbi:hypothetical protein TNCV_4484931 [Trichonephila clavipes]|nr:hypothetical protein TNCV_4484931 [Trichonephila clavipes]
MTIYRSLSLNNHVIFLGFCEGDTENRWRDGQVCPDVDKELWRCARRLGVCFGVGQVCPDVDKALLGALRPRLARGVFWRVSVPNKKKEVKRDFGDLRIKKKRGRVVNTPGV